MKRPSIAAGSHSLAVALAIALTPAAAPALRADGPADNLAEKVRSVPPPGLAIPEDARQELTDGVAKLAANLDAARTEFAKQPDRLALLPDVQIFHKAVDWALRYNEFFRTNEVGTARTQLQTLMLTPRGRFTPKHSDRVAPEWSKSNSFSASPPTEFMGRPQLAL